MEWTFYEKKGGNLKPLCTIDDVKEANAYRADCLVTYGKDGFAIIAANSFDELPTEQPLEA